MIEYPVKLIASADAVVGPKPGHGMSLQIDRGAEITIAAPDADGVHAVEVVNPHRPGGRRQSRRARTWPLLGSTATLDQLPVWLPAELRALVDAAKRTNEGEVRT